MTNAPAKPAAAPATSAEVRARLAHALNLDLIGPPAGHELAEERIPGWVRPSNWYLTGFLVPTDAPPAQSADADEEEELDETPAVAGLAEESVADRRSARRSFFPSSIGISALVAAGAEALDVTVRWGDYVLAEPDEGGSAPWQRKPFEVALRLPLRAEHSEPVPSSDGLCIHLRERQIDASKLRDMPAGTRAVSLFLVNQRKPAAEHRLADIAYAFQAELEVHCEQPFVPRPNPRQPQADDWDENVADLHYADTPEYATGHGVSADWELRDGQCNTVRTAWIARAHVPRTETSEVPGAELSMEALGELADGAAAKAALTPLVQQYRAWIESQREALPELAGTRRQTAEELLRRAGTAAERMATGIDALAVDADALDAFRLANRAVARALRQRLLNESPRWRAFQLAFILLNLAGLADPNDLHRNTVDLLFFPTGGGKTEAYLGLAALAMVLRRLRNPQANGKAGAGVSVVMRYTLRLLTLDQLSRAAGLVCALELEREQDPERYGEWPFEIGLWVGKAATPNVMGRKGENRSDSARAKTRQFKANPQGRPAPIPLENCPWCAEPFHADSFTLWPNDDNPTELRVVCGNFECKFSGERPLPVLGVDEPIYQRLPAFLIATVDKFASLPWEGKSGKLLGGAERHDQRGFYGAAESAAIGEKLPAPLPPPDLVIQDELHLISGPLGTMVGLYETVIDALCTRRLGEGERAYPKIVASTATVRQAQTQIQALFARQDTHIFPPPGVRRQDSFFAHRVPADEEARLYLGVTASGRSPKVLMRRVWLALMAAAQKAYRDAGGAKNESNPADPYMTVLGYFNSLRELGGARRILEEEVSNTVQHYGQRKRIGEPRGLFQDRRRLSDVIELTSRVSTDQVADARRRLEAAFHEKRRVDWAIATNMISVGLDIQRLGLMLVLGQPKSHAEYIQATSRVGRDPQRPGLVATLLNMHKPRDRSHYERFRHYHETFYRSVEVASVTPFSARALDRGFAGALVAASRHLDGRLTPAEGADRIAEASDELERRLAMAFAERIAEQPFEDERERDDRRGNVELRVRELLAAWHEIVTDYHQANVQVKYQQYEMKQRRPLLREMLDTQFESDLHRLFRANRSLRDVEPEVNLYLRERAGSIVSRAFGSVRQSQVITTYGPGALIDLPAHSAIVGGLDTWPKDLQEIVEPRLSQALQRITDVPAPRLYAPPPAPSEPWAAAKGIGAWRFPEWFVVQEDPYAAGGDSEGRSQSRRLVQRKALDERGKFERIAVVPTRFVRACPRGHVDDVDWPAFVHGPDSSCRRQLWLDERGTTGGLGELTVRCECGKSRNLSEASDINANALGMCRGARPWLGRNTNEECEQMSRLLIRTATNAYFPQVQRVLSLPDTGSAVQEAVVAVWDVLQAVQDATMLTTFKAVPKVAQALKPFEEAQVLRAIEEVRSGTGQLRPLKEAELEALLGAEEGFGNEPPIDANFHARRLPDSAWRAGTENGNRIAAVVQLHRLREVLALVGFTRLDAVTPDIHGDFESDVMRAEIALEPHWFPAVENRGEGVFLELSAHAVADWQQRPAVADRVAKLANGHELWRQTRNTQRPFPGGAYILLHTLAHLLVQALAMRCGYPASSIRERIYAEETPAGQRHGILLYTGTPDAEGTLGGLVQQGRHIEGHLADALRTAALCSNDPICAQHVPDENTAKLESRLLHGAACHGCSLIAETSCEMRNDFLDRALVVPVLGLEDAAFFELPE